MANQSLASVPPNVEDPMVLQRFLSRLVEQLDIVLGNRAGPTEQYVSQEQLLLQAEELTQQLEDARLALQQVLLRLEDTDELIVEELTKRIEAVEDKNDEQDAVLDVLKNVAAIKAVMLSFTVDGLGEPDIEVNFNVKTNSTRISTGLYEFEVEQLTFEGINILDNIVTSLAWFIQPSATSESYGVEFVDVATPGS